MAAVSTELLRLRQEARRLAGIWGDSTLRGQVDSLVAGVERAHAARHEVREDLVRVALERRINEARKRNGVQNPAPQPRKRGNGRGRR